MNASRLGFFVIGAMKAGTTSLHYYLKSHPTLYLPVEKEVPFFAFDALYEKGMDWYLEEFFPKARTEQLLGTVSPQYMLDPRVPQRMHAACPDAKLIALLRDPIERARSHYKMMVRAFGEKRSFEEAVDGQYARCGEYGHVLGEYLKLFPREQLLVAYSQAFEADPAAVVGRICRFLGVPDLGGQLELRRRNAASDAHTKPLRRTLANLIHFRLRAFKPLAKAVIPDRYTRRLGKWSILYRSGISGPGAIDATLSRAKESELARRFIDDAQRLCAITGELPPWYARLAAIADDEANARARPARRPGGAV